MCGSAARGYDVRLFSLLDWMSAPTHIVWGQQGRLIPVECGSLYQQAIPGAKLTIVEQCGHVPHLEKPEEFGRMALSFLA